MIRESGGQTRYDNARRQRHVGRRQNIGRAQAVVIGAQAILEIDGGVPASRINECVQYGSRSSQSRGGLGGCKRSDGSGGKHLIRSQRGSQAIRRHQPVMVRSSSWSQSTDVIADGKWNI